MRIDQLEQARELKSRLDSVELFYQQFRDYQERHRREYYHAEIKPHLSKGTRQVPPEVPFEVPTYVIEEYLFSERNRLAAKLRELDVEVEDWEENEKC